MSLHKWNVWLMLLAVVCFCPAVKAEKRFVDAEKELKAAFGEDLTQVPGEAISRAIEKLAATLPEEGAIDLPRSVATGKVDFRPVADRVQITGGFGGEITLGGGQDGIQMLFSNLDMHVEQGLTTESKLAMRQVAMAQVANGGLAASAKAEGKKWDFKDIKMFEPATPASNLLAMYCKGSIKINNKVENCAWIAADNAFGTKVVTANAPVNDSLFLWFGTNWGFADYNAHWKNPDKNWLDNTQMHIDAKGEGQGTRFYLMVETNYGNPGPGVIVENAKGMAFYHGSTERGSAQGPGQYWIRNCENVQLGLRAINAFFPVDMVDRQMPLPQRDMTIEGGKGNILHGIRMWGSAWEDTLVNSDPELQMWMTSLEFDGEGVDSPDILKFAYTPNLHTPSEDWLKGKDDIIKEKAAKILELTGEQVPPKTLEEAERMVRHGLKMGAPMNAVNEVTFNYAGKDLTQGVDSLPGNRKLPAPPSMPATDAPTVRGEIAFTQQADFGKALLEAGADPTGKKPSDDAFAQVLYGMNRDEVQKIINEIEHIYTTEINPERDYKRHGTAEQWGRINDLVNKLHPVGDSERAQRRMIRIKRDRVEFPAGRFRVEKPIIVFGQTEVWGAGPDKTIIFTDNDDISVIDLRDRTSVCNFAVEGGRVGLAIVGADHHEKAPGTMLSYVSGQNFYGLTFRNQKFAGIHIGTEDIEIAGGAEFDQNRMVDMVFENTGDYGIYMNQDMLDKWLLLHAKFEGQKKAGLSIKFNNLIHGAVIGCEFKNIDGPGIDFMGGNPRWVMNPWGVMVDQTDFIECGNSESPAVDMGYAELASITRTRIITKDKTVAVGYQGSAQIYEDVLVDVKLPENAPAMKLRAVRNNNVARANGHTLRGVQSNGPVVFINDANAYNERFAKTMKTKGYDHELDWDANSAAHEYAPKNGWVHPFVIYQSQFGDEKIDYQLWNVNTDEGKVVKKVDLSKLN